MIRDRLPKGFDAWVAATVGSDLGSGVLAFALTWVATGYGPGTASMVLTLTVAPTVLFGLLGGAVADRYGPRRVMITCTIALMLVSATLALVVSAQGLSEVTLLVAAALIGSIAAFHRPAIGVFPRLFVAGNALGTAMARVGMASQLAGTLAPPLGGLLVGAVALNGVAWVDVVGCLIMVTTLVMIHPPLRPTVAADATTFRGIRDGIAVAARTRGVTALLLCVGIVAGAVLPAVILGVPLAARERGWSSTEAGVIEAGWIAGGLVAGAWFSWRGTAARPWRPMAVGPFIVAIGLIGLAVSPTWPVATASTCVLGAGVVIFTAHVFPTYVLLAPETMLSRFQSLLMMVQRAPQLVITPLIGIVATAIGAGRMIAFAGGVAVLASIVVVSDKTLRTFTAEEQHSEAG